MYSDIENLVLIMMNICLGHRGWGVVVSAQAFQYDNLSSNTAQVNLRTVN